MRDKKKSLLFLTPSQFIVKTFYFQSSEKWDIAAWGMVVHVETRES
jgi:hypothetical protein